MRTVFVQNSMVRDTVNKQTNTKIKRLTCERKNTCACEYACILWVKMVDWLSVNQMDCLALQTIGTKEVVWAHCYISLEFTEKESYTTFNGQYYNRSQGNINFA